MRVIRIELRDFMSYEYLDWRLDEAKLVCLTGANGAGKSALASEAIAYALFDAARLRGDDLVRTGATDMSVLVEFEFAGACYRVVRGRTTRSGGKSTLEFAIASSDRQTWLPLTADSIRETQQAIADLLRLDADTFEAAVLLAQGHAGRFADATPGDRKRVYGQVLGLSVYEDAEKRARELAHDLDASLAATRKRVEDIEVQLASSDPAAAQAWALAELERVGSITALALQKRDEADAQLHELAGSLVVVEAAGADVRRIEAELDEHKDRWRRASEARATAEEAIARATAAMAEADDVAKASADLPAARHALAGAEHEAAAWVAARDAVLAAEKRMEDALELHLAAVREHDAYGRRLAERERMLDEHIAGLASVTCPNCAHEFAADPAGLQEQLLAARAELAGHGAAPEEPLRVARERAQVTRREIDLKALAEPRDLDGMRRRLLEQERTAARAGEIEAQRQALTDAQGHLVAAADEQASIEAAGKAARAALAEAQDRVQQGTAVRERTQAATDERKTILDGLAALEAERTTLVAAKARADAEAEQHERLEAERDAARETIAHDQVELGYYRRLVAAFGVSGIPARIIDSTLPELTGHINDVLSAIRPGWSLEMRTQRAKKSGDGVVEALDLIVHSDTGVRPFAAASGGEAMSLHLAIAVGLSRLIARRAGTAIRTLIADEPDELDAESRRALGQALKVLSHHGELERIVVVTHTPDLAEFGDAVYQVSRDEAGSHVELVA